MAKRIKKIAIETRITRLMGTEFELEAPASSAVGDMDGLGVGREVGVVVG